LCIRTIGSLGSGRRKWEAYGNADEDTNGDTSCNSQSSLSVVLRGEEFGVLQCSVGLVVSVKLCRHATVDWTLLTTDYGELRTTKDGIGVKVRHGPLLSSDLDATTTGWSCSIQHFA
jgi:hypothetical protein